MPNITRKKNGYTESLALAEDDKSPQKTIATILQGMEIAKDANPDKIETLYACLQNYIQFCMQNNITVTNAGVYAACGLSRKMVSDWSMRKHRADDPRYKAFADQIKSICSQYREISMATGALNPVVGIWWQKAHDGYTETPPLEEEKEDRLGEKRTASALEQKYRHLLKD